MQPRSARQSLTPATWRKLEIDILSGEFYDGSGSGVSDAEFVRRIPCGEGGDIYTEVLRRDQVGLLWSSIRGSRRAPAMEYRSMPDES